jgi:hypothetical protein
MAAFDAFGTADVGYGNDLGRRSKASRSAASAVLATTRTPIAWTQRFAS